MSYGDERRDTRLKRRFRDEDRLAAWLGAREQASADLVAGDAVARALLDLRTLDEKPWQGSAADLLDVLGRGVPESVRTRREWPTSPRGLSGALRRLAPDLRRVGLTIELPERARTARERMITIRQRRVGRDTQDRQDAADGRTNGSSDPVCPVAPTAHATGRQQDVDSANVSGAVTGVSDLSCRPQTDRKSELRAGPDVLRVGPMGVTHGHTEAGENDGDSGLY
jgi:hypothetical protein